MTIQDLLVAARKLSAEERGQLAAELIKDLGRPAFAPPGMAVMAAPKLTEVDLASLRVIFQLAVEKVRAAPVDFVRQAHAHAVETLGKAAGN